MKPSLPIEDFCERCQIVFPKGVYEHCQECHCCHVKGEHVYAEDDF
jgi:hypothetical protein